MRDDGTRRPAIAELADAVRALSDAAAETGIDLGGVASVASEIRSLTARLRAVRHGGAYSGLYGRGLDLSTPVGPLPLSPVIGDCNPSAPDVRLEFADGRVVGTARLTRRHVGAPGIAHGGVSAMIADQLVGVTPHLLGRICVTRWLTVRYRRPVPLEAQVDLAAWGEAIDDIRSRAWCTIHHEGALLLEGEAEMVVAPSVIPGSAGTWQPNRE